MTWRIAAALAWVSDEVGGVVYALPMPPTRPQILEGVLADIWFALSRGEEPTRSMATLHDLAPEAIRDDVEAALRQMRNLGLVELDGNG